MDKDEKGKARRGTPEPFEVRKCAGAHEAIIAPPCYMTVKQEAPRHQEGPRRLALPEPRGRTKLST